MNHQDRMNLMKILPKMKFRGDSNDDERKNINSRKSFNVDTDIEKLERLTHRPVHFKKTIKKLPDNIRNLKTLEIVPFPTSKDKIKQRQCMTDNVLPRHPSSVIINGKSGSGKTQLLLSLMCRPECYGADEKGKHYFDEIYLFSPTAGEMDDLVKHLLDFTILSKDNIFNEFDESKLMKILDDQKKEIEEKKFARSKKIAILLDDIQSSNVFLRSKTILKLFIMNRHYNISTFLCGQSFVKTPRSCRLQANNIFYFAGSKSETDKIIEEFAPPKLTKRDFEDLINQVLDEPYNFLHINMRVPWKIRYRKNLDTIIEID